MATVYYENHVVTITYEEESQLGMAVWNGFLNSQEFREAITNCVRLIEERKLLRWLGDNRKMKAIRPVDQEWFVENILPRLQQSALRRNAVLVSEDFFNRTAVEQIYRRAEGQGEMITKEFSNRIMAVAWLREPITTPA
ncbi:hypothetical protein [Rufibacter tibetensis]|uniref:STAS/SEC14 domain-containing protein n=1 Tax=Rufibacter tibetensis TaxID=512763 RepID=A0A0P0CV20_9BACT|nr:hypothetical protein [Rufibacter tibetensis]ALI99161.1 hypothetical protein DC20_09460 [Rufibacter tibetensis]